MSKFNKITDIKSKLEDHPDAIINYEGALAFKLDPYTELYIRAASCMVGEKKFYTDEKESDKLLLESINKIAEIDPSFLLKLAIYCREELHLRSIPLVLIGEFANNPLCIGKVNGSRKYISRCIQRADELTELIAYQFKRNEIMPRNKTKLPMAIQFGIRDAFTKFDRYQLSKYGNKKKNIKMRDSMFFSHPKPKDKEQQETFEKLANNELEPPLTWEVMRSTRRMTWHEIINDIFYKNGKINNYMAQIRNLRNCLKDSNVTGDDILLLCRMVSDRDAVLKSKLLPYRFLAAYKELIGLDTLYGGLFGGFRRGRRISEKEQTDDSSLSPDGNIYFNNVLDALEIAASYSIDSIPKFSGSTLIACDVSGSMHRPITKNSRIELYDIGLMMGVMSKRIFSYTITGIFGDIWKTYPMASSSSGILKNTIDMKELSNEVGYSTNGYLVIKWLLENDIRVDRILIFTDCQMWDSNRYLYGDKENTFAEYFIKYQRRYPGVILYCLDLAGYGNIMLPQETKNVCLIGGFSERIFDFIDIFERLKKEGSVVIDRIKAIVP